MKNKLFLLSELLRRDLAARYAGSYAGPLWAVLNPAIVCLLNAFVFAYVLRVSPPSGFRGNYVEYLIAGLLPWLGLQEAVLRATTSVSDGAHLVKKLRFPVGLLTASAAGAALVIQAIAVTLLAVVFAVRSPGRVDPFALGLAFAFEVVLLAGPILFLASLNVFFRDLAQLVTPLLMIAFYLTPILYPESMVPERVAPLLALNPFRDAIALFRAGLVGTALPPWPRLGVEAATFLVLGFAGRQLFRRLRPAFADLL